MIGILSDAHGNHRAFVRAVEILRNIGATQFLFLGDAVGYIPSAKVVGSLLEMGEELLVCVRGNHEDMLIRQEFDAKRDAVYQLQSVGAQLSRREHAFISSWVPSISIDTSGGRLLLVHGSPEDPTYGYVYPDTDLTHFSPDADFVFMGHTHRPFVRQQNGVTFVNVGSCGLPRDNGKYGAAAVFDEKERSVRVVRFDISAASERTLDESPQVHRSVSEVFERRREFFGEVYDQ